LALKQHGNFSNAPELKMIETLKDIMYPFK